MEAGELNVPEEPKDLELILKHHRALEKKNQLKETIENFGLRKSNNINMKEMDRKLQILEENYWELEEDPEAFEEKLGLPISKSSKAVKNYSEKLHMDPEEQRRLREEAEAYISKMRDDSYERVKKRERRIAK